MSRMVEKIPLVIIGVCLIGIGIAAFMKAQEQSLLIARIPLWIATATAVFFGLYIEINTFKRNP